MGKIAFYYIDKSYLYYLKIPKELQEKYAEITGKEQSDAPYVSVSNQKKTQNRQ